MQMKNKDRLIELYKRLFDDYIESLIEINRLEEINKEHQKINGNLQKRINELENILKGKSIQELGISEFYNDNHIPHID